MKNGRSWMFSKFLLQTPGIQEEKGGGRETFAINLIPIDLTPAAAAAAV